MIFVVGLVIDAALIGTILIVMTGEFPGWGTVVGCVLAVGVASNVVAALLPWPASLLGLLAGAAVGGAIISWVTSVDFRRAAKAAGIYLGIRLVLTLLFVQLLK